MIEGACVCPNPGCALHPPLLRPHTCPVCGGNGFVSQGFYAQTSGQWTSTSTAQEPCRSCQGTGVVWGPAADPVAL